MRVMDFHTIATSSFASRCGLGKSVNDFSDIIFGCLPVCAVIRNFSFADAEFVATVLPVCFIAGVIELHKKLRAVPVNNVRDFTHIIFVAIVSSLDHDRANARRRRNSFHSGYY